MSYVHYPPDARRLAAKLHVGPPRRTGPEIARLLATAGYSVNPSTVWRWLRKTEDYKPSENRAPRSKATTEEIVARRGRGETWQAIGDAVGMSAAGAYGRHRQFLARTGQLD